MQKIRHEYYDYLLIADLTQGSISILHNCYGYVLKHQSSEQQEGSQTCSDVTADDTQ
jgi:hypothetical protein